MDATIQAWKKKMPSKRQLASTINHIVQQKSVAVLYSPTEVERIKKITDMITQATSEFESDEDWERMLKVVDALSSISNQAVLKESVRYLKLRLGDPSSRVIILTLTLIESIVKNCGDLVHQEIASESFMNEMETLYKTHANKRGRASMEIASRVLDMIQAWGEAFLPFRHVFPLFVETYHNMRMKGIKFPDQYNESKVPVLTPPSEVTIGKRSAVAIERHQQNQGLSSIDTSSYSNTSSRLGGLSTLELYRVATNVLEMLEDMLYEAQKNTSALSKHGVMKELVMEAREIVHRMKGAIPIAVIEEDENLEKYLSVNDDLHAALKKYDELLEKDQSKVEKSDVKTTKNVVAEIDLIDPFGLKEDVSLQNKPNNHDVILDDPFADFVHMRTGSKIEITEQNKSEESLKSKAETKVVSTVLQKDKEEKDPFASFVQQRATKILGGSNQDVETKRQSGETLQPAAPMKDLIDLWGDVPAVTPVLAQAAAAKPDLWLQDDDLVSSSNHSCATLASASTMTPAHDAFTAYSNSITRAAHPTSSRTTSCTIVGTSASDSFEMLDFSSKVSLAPAAALVAAPAIASAPALAPANSNTVHLRPSAYRGQAASQSPPATESFNPFDF